MSDKKEKNNLKKKLVYNYRLVISSEENWEEKISLRLNRLNVFVGVIIMSGFLIFATIVLISFTGLKEYIPGYESSTLRRNVQNNAFKVDSLVSIIESNQLYINNMAMILSGEFESIDQKNDSLTIAIKNNANTADLKGIDFSTSKEDSIFRVQVEVEDRYNVFDSKPHKDIILVAPISGSITAGYNVDKKHFATDIAVTKGTPVVAVADGTVIFSEWTSETGNVVIVDHGRNLISVCKHNSSSTVQQGDFVESGQVIAISGTSGEYSTGPHLHFELWYNGYPVDPTNFIDFEL